MVILRDKICNRIKDSFMSNPDIICSYVYGSFLNNNYNESRSDIDILMILSDQPKSANLIEDIKAKSESMADLRLDINLVFESEFNRRWHIYRPPTYYVGVKLRNIRLFGEDLLEKVREDEITSEMIFKRAVDLSQSSRGIYINLKDPEFWRKKYIKWLKVLALEVLYLHGDFDLSFDSGLKKLISLNSDFKCLEIISSGEVSMKSIAECAEYLRKYLLENFIIHGKN